MRPEGRGRSVHFVLRQEGLHADCRLNRRIGEMPLVGEEGRQQRPVFEDVRRAGDAGLDHQAVVRPSAVAATAGRPAAGTANRVKFGQSSQPVRDQHVMALVPADQVAGDLSSCLSVSLVPVSKSPFRLRRGAGIPVTELRFLKSARKRAAGQCHTPRSIGKCRKQHQRSHHTGLRRVYISGARMTD